jgi:hypothetical protein
MFLSLEISSRNLTIVFFTPNIQPIGMVRNHVTIRIPSRVNRERAATEQVHSEIHCSIFRINSGVFGWYCWWCRCTGLFQRQIYFRRRDWYGTSGTIRLLWHQFTLIVDSLGYTFPATSTRSQSASWAINLDSWLSSSLQHDHQSLPKVSSAQVVFRGRVLLRRRDACLDGPRNHLHDRPARVFGCGERDSHTYYVTL